MGTFFFSTSFLFPVPGKDRSCRKHVRRSSSFYFDVVIEVRFNIFSSIGTAVIPMLPLTLPVVDYRSNYFCNSRSLVNRSCSVENP